MGVIVVCWDTVTLEKRPSNQTSLSIVPTAITSLVVLIYQMGVPLLLHFFNDRVYLALLEPRRRRERGIARPKKFYEFLAINWPSFFTMESVQ